MSVRVCPSVLGTNVDQTSLTSLSSFPRTRKALLEHCGLEFEEKRVMEFYKSQRVVHTFSSTQVRTGIYTHAVGESLS